MGDNFLEEQAKNSKKRRAKAKSKMETPKLFERADEITDEFTIDCREGQQLSSGDVLRCFPGDNGNPVEVARDHQNVGCVGDGGGNVLRNYICKAGVGKLRVLNVNPLTGSAQAEFVKE